MKKCKKCLIEQDDSNFSKNKNNKDGLVNYCKKCEKIRSSNYRIKNKEKINLKNKIRRNNNPEKYSIKEPLVKDGIFGEKTKKLTMEFQKNEGLTQDGIVGGKTFNQIRMVGYDTKNEYRKNCKSEPPSYMFDD